MTGIDALRALVTDHGDDLPLDEAAIAIAVDEDPACRPDAVRADLDTLARATGFAASDGVAAGRVLGRINEVLYARLGFAGAADPGPDGVCIHTVLGRRRGTAVGLSVVYVEVARRLGVALDGVGFPVHFLLRPRHATSPVFVDPAHRGRLLDEDQVWGLFRHLYPGARVTEATWRGILAPVPRRAVAARVVRDLKVWFVDRGDPEGVLRACERLLVLDPSPEEHRDRGLVLADLGRVAEAREALATYLALAPEADDAGLIGLHLARL